NDPEKIMILDLVEDGSELCELLRADPSGRKEGCSRHPGRKTDQRDVAATPDKGKAALAVVVAHIRAPLPSGESAGLAHVNVVIARDESYVLGRAEALQPVAAARKFSRQGYVGDIAGHRNVVGRLRSDIGCDCRKHSRIMHKTAISLPVD